MADVKEKKKESKKAKGEGEEKDGKRTKEAKDGKSTKETKDSKSTKEVKDAKSKKDKDKDKDSTESSKKGGAKEGDKKGAAAKEEANKPGVATLPVDPNAPPPLDSEGNPICVQPDPKPTFEELWFDDPVEGEYAQKMALELKGRIEVKALSIRQYLVIPTPRILSAQGRFNGSSTTAVFCLKPTNAAEYLAAFLLRNNPLKDVDFVEPPDIPSPAATPPTVEPPKCCGCKVHCPAAPTYQEDVPDFFRKGDTPAAAEVLKKDEKLAPTQAPKKPSA